MKRKAQALQVLGRTLWWSCALAIAINAGAAAWHVASPESASKVSASSLGGDEPAYMTCSLGTWRGDLPMARPVSVVDQISVDGRTPPEGSVWAGQYDPVDDDITVIRDAGAITLAHEYGHALLLDLITKQTGGGSRAMSVFQGLEDCDRSTDPSKVPEWLRQVFAAYTRSGPEPFGDPYYGTSFNEYFAESFAWTVELRGDEVAPAARTFFAKVENDRAREETASPTSP